MKRYRFRIDLFSLPVDLCSGPPPPPKAVLNAI
jgi:hypothetical protein